MGPSLPYPSQDDCSIELKLNRLVNSLPSLCCTIQWGEGVSARTAKACQQTPGGQEWLQMQKTPLGTSAPRSMSRGPYGPCFSLS